MENETRKVVIKASLPRDLKHQFKSLCAQRGVTMTVVITHLTESWVDTKISSDFIREIPSAEEKDLEDIKVYIAASLKTQFKVVCAQRNLAQRLILYNLIDGWIKGDL